VSSSRTTFAQLAAADPELLAKVRRQPPDPRLALAETLAAGPRLVRSCGFDVVGFGTDGNRQQPRLPTSR